MPQMDLIVVKRISIHKSEEVEDGYFNMSLSCFKLLQSFLPGIYVETLVNGKPQYSKNNYMYRRPLSFMDHAQRMDYLNN